MSHAFFAAALQAAEEPYRQLVMQETWGHLAPRRNKIYRGRIVYAVGVFGSDRLNPTVIFCELGDLSSSPWFYDALMEFVQSFGKEGPWIGGKRPPKPPGNEEGCVYEWTGHMRNYEFVGHRRLIFDANKKS